MSLHPARDEMEARKKRDAIELCGKNRGSHDYIPIEWEYTKPLDKNDPFKNERKKVTRLLCRVCFCNVDTVTLLKTYRDVSDY